VNQMSTDTFRRRGRMARSGLILLSGTGGDVVLTFLRSFVLAHLISPTEFGLATALAVAIGFAEVIADIGIDNSAMRQGGDPKQHNVLATLHTILLVRAGIVGLVLLLIGGPLAAFFHAPEAALSFSLLGVVAFIRGFAHLQSKEMIRDFRYGPDAIVNIVTSIAWTAVTVAAAFVLMDYRCMLYGIMASAIAYVAASHLVATVPWRLGWSRSEAREALAFGAPLVPNGLALALSGMADRFLIGALLGPGTLAAYNVGAMAVFMPRSIVLRVLMAVAVPAFLKHGYEDARRTRAYDYWTIALAAISAGYGLAFVCFGSYLVGLVFGRIYEPSQGLASLLAISVYLKFMITFSTPTALASGQTRFVLATSILASAGMVIGAAAALAKPDLTVFMAGVAGGEFIALLWVIHKSTRLFPFSPRFTWWVSLAPLVVLAATHFACAQFEADAILARIEVFAVSGLAAVLLLAAALFVAKMPLVPSFLKHF
jgi:O-antigen/teichoic acid export membrane protein